MGSAGYLLNGPQEGRFIRLGRFIVAADLAHELQGGRPDFGIIGRWIKLVEGFDIATDDAPPVSERLSAANARCLQTDGLLVARAYSPLNPFLCLPSPKEW